MTKVIILTGGELRHDFVRKKIACDPNIEVLASFCEGAEKSLKKIVEKSDHCDLRMKHLSAREQSEEDYFRLFVESVDDNSNPICIPKGSVNDEEVVQKIRRLAPDLILAYGCSIVRSQILTDFSGRFINVHLGLSPYYRGSGTNFWPLVNGEPEFVGATFMYIDEGIDTGEVIHQIRSRIVFGDTPVNIGNRLILDVADTYIKLAKAFPNIRRMSPEIFNSSIDERYYRKKDFSEQSVVDLYQKFMNGLVESYVDSLAERIERAPIVENPDIEKNADAYL